MSDIKPGRAFVEIDVEGLLDHLEAVEAALRASTELLRDMAKCLFPYVVNKQIQDQIAANEAVLGGENG